MPRPMTPLTPDFRATLADAQPPCLSLYQPTHGIIRRISRTRFASGI